MVTQLASDLLLTGTAAACTNTAQTGGYGQHTLYIEYQPDTNSTNALHVYIDLSYDGTNWHPYTGEYSGATGTITPGDAVILEFGSDGTSDQNESPYYFVGSAMAVRIRCLETNTPGDYGNYTAWLISTSA